jgi:TPR repeat protein
MTLWKIYPKKNKSIYSTYSYTKEEKNLKITQVIRYCLWLCETHDDNPPQINSSTNLNSRREIKKDKKINSFEIDYSKYYEYGRPTYECTGGLKNEESISADEIDEPTDYGWELDYSETFCKDLIIEKITENENSVKRVPVELPLNYIPTEEEEYMNPYQIEYFRQLILDKQQRLTYEYQKEISDRTVPREIGLWIAKSKIVIERIDAEDLEYGWCVNTGLEIGIKRLLEYPLASKTFEEEVREAAEQGDVSAQCNLGVMYSNGQGVAQDDQQAVTWFRKAAEQGEVNAQYNLGVMYQYGEGVPQDDQQAVTWYRKAAEQGHARAQSNLGVMYDQGQGVAQDFQQAVTWYRKAAEQSNASAQYNLGLMYKQGLGVAQDNQQAVTWFRKASEQGIEEASNQLKKLQTN